MGHTKWAAQAPYSKWNGGIPDIAWSASNLRTEGGIVAQTISSVATDYIYVQVTATLPNGTPINPTSDVVKFAFLPSDASPVSSTTWYLGSWAAGTPYTAQCLVGPSGGVTTLAPSNTGYGVWLMIVDNPETPVIFAGRISVT